MLGAAEIKRLLAPFGADIFTFDVLAAGSRNGDGQKPILTEQNSNDQANELLKADSHLKKLANRVRNKNERCLS